MDMPRSLLLAPASGTFTAHNWHGEQLRVIAARRSVDAGRLTALEVYVQPRAGHFDESRWAQQAAQARLDALRVSACAEAGVNFVEISGMWRPMLGSVLHKRGDALDIVAVDAGDDRLPEFKFRNNNVRGDALAKRFSALLHDHRYADAGQHIYKFDDYPHGADGDHWHHLHITCNSRRVLEVRDLAGFRAPGDPDVLFPPAVSCDIGGMERPWLVR